MNSRLTPRLCRAGLLLGLMMACSDGPLTPSPTMPGPPRTEPESRSAEPAREVAYAPAPAPPQGAGGEPGRSESVEGGEASPQAGETRAEMANAPEPPPSPGNPEPPPENPGGGEGGEEEEEGEKKGEGEEEEEEENVPRQQIPCDRVGSASISASTKTDTEIDLRWSFSTEPECEQGAFFNVTRTLMGVTVRISLPSSGNTETDENLTPGTRYQYRVVATSADGEFLSSTYGWTLPATPAGFTATRKESSPATVVLKWTEVSHADSYQYREDVGDTGTYGEPRGIAAGSPHELSGKSTETEWCYQIRAVQGTRHSAWAEKKCVGIPPTPPPRPRDFRVTAMTASSITLEWTRERTAGSYAIYHSTLQNSDFGSATNVGNVTTYTVEDLRAATGYRFWIWSVAGSEKSPSPSATTGETDRTELNPPTNFRSTGATESSIDLAWASAEGATGEQVRYKRADRSRWGSWNGTDSRRSHTLTGLDTDTPYNIEIRSVKGSTESGAESITVSTARRPPPPPCDAPDAPSAPTATVSDDDVMVSWGSVSVPAGCDAVQYRLSRDGAEVATTSKTTYTDQDLAPGRYSYRVLAESLPGRNPSSEVGPATVIVGGGPPPEDCDITAATIAVDDKSQTWVELSWTHSDNGECSSVVYDVTGENLSLMGTTDRTARANDLVANTGYTYTVRAHQGSEEASGAVPVTTLPTMNRPLPPTGLTASAQSFSSVLLIWTAANGAESHEVRYRESGARWRDEDWVEADSDAVHTVTGLEAETGYDFQVRTVAGAERSEPATATERTPVRPVGPQPTSRFRSVLVTGPTIAIELRWWLVTGADSYELRYWADGETPPETWENVGQVTNHTVTGLTEGTEYHFELVTVQGTMRSSPAELTARAYRLSIPEGVAVTATSRTAVTVSWRAVAGGARYVIEVLQGSGGRVVARRVSTTTSSSFTGLEAATEYCATVAANFPGGGMSGESEEVCGRTWGGPPAGLRVSGMSEDFVELAWDVAPGATGYRLYRGAEGTAATETTHRSVGLLGGRSYAFGVAAVYDREESGRSGELTATTPSLQPPAGVPSAQAVESGVMLSWSAGSGGGEWTGPGGSGTQELEYAVERRTPPETGTWMEVASGLSATEWEDGSVATAADYEYRVLTTVSIRGGVLRSSPGDPVMVMAAGPAPPEDLAATALSSVKIRVSWTPAPGADGYELQWIPGGGRPETASIDAGAAPSYEHAELTPGTRYTYQVRTRVGSGAAAVFSAWTDPVSESTGVLPVPKNLLAMETSATSVRLSWDAVEAADRYQIRRRDMVTEGYWTFEVTGATSYEDTGLMAEREYRYQVQTVVVRPGVSYQSAWTTEQPVTPMLPEPRPTATALSAVEIEVTWPAVAAATGYELEWRLGSGDWTAVAGLRTEARYAHKKGLRPDTEYSYHVRAVRESGGETARSGWSYPPETARTEALPVPENLLAMESSATSVRLSWDAVPEAEGYDVERMRAGQTSPDLVPVRDGGTTHEDTNLLAEVEYHYRVRSVVVRSGVDYLSAWSDPPVPVTPMLADPELTVRARSSVTVELSWTAVAAATGYELEWSSDGEAWTALASGPERSHEHGGRTPRAVYHYRVRSLRVADGETARSDGTRQPVTMPDPDPPENLVAAALSATSVRLSWDAEEGAERYEVRRRAGGESVSFRATETTYDDTGLSTGTEYLYDVQAVVVRAGREYRSQSSAPPVTVRPGLPAPESVTAAERSSVMMELSWDEVSGATGYQFRWRRGRGAWTEEAALLAGTTGEHRNLHPRSDYEYAVRAVRTADGRTVRSEWSKPPVAAMTPPLEVPENLTAMQTSAVSVSLSWDAVPAADRYNLRREDMTVPGYQEFEVSGRTSYEDEGLVAEREYRYQVQTVVVRPGVSYQSLWTDPAPVTPMLRPPENVRAAAPDAVTVELSWDASPGAEGYRVRWRAGRGAWTVEPADVTATSYPHPRRDPGTDYSYRVLSYSGTEESEWSHPPAEVTTGALPAPSGLTASVTGTAVTLTWEAVPVADGYRVWRQEMASGSSTVTPVSGPEFEDRTVTLEVEYEYYVLTLLARPGGDVTSAPSRTVTATPTLQPPQGLTATVESATVIELSWDPSEGASGYEFRWRKGTEDWSAARDVGSGTTYRHERLDPATRHWYQVRAVQGRHESGWSGEDDATTAVDTGPPVPTGLSATSDSPFAATVTWDPASGAESYELRWRKDDEARWESLELTGARHEADDLAPDTTYVYEVQSRRGERDSAWSAPAPVTTAEFTAPANFTAPATGATTVELSWDESPGTEVEYRIRWRTPGTRGWMQPMDVTGSSHTVTGLSADTEYEFRIFGFRQADGERQRTSAVDTDARTQAE